MKQTVSVAGGAIGIVLVATGLAVAATPPATVKIDMVAGDKGAVELMHKQHVDSKLPDGKPIVCKDCHHALKGPTPGPGETVASCTSCHAVNTPKTVGGAQAPVLAMVSNGKAELKTVLLHRSCRDKCHKEVKLPGKSLTACSTCHKK